MRLWITKCALKGFKSPSTSITYFYVVETPMTCKVIITAILVVICTSNLCSKKKDFPNMKIILKIQLLFIVCEWHFKVPRFILAFQHCHCGCNTGTYHVGNYLLSMGSFLRFAKWFQVCSNGLTD